MRIPLRNTNNSIGAVVVCFSFFMALMLFQTSYLRLGTLTAAVTLFLTLIAYVFQNGPRLRLNMQNVALVLYMIHVLTGTIIHGYRPGYMLSFVGQMILCAVLFSVDVSKREQQYLKAVFVCASVVYAVLAVISMYQNAREGYIHTGIELFNTEFDPNFIGIPLVAAMAVLLYSALNAEHTGLCVVLYTVIAAAIVYTASRGSFVSALVSGGVVFVQFLFQSKKRFGERLFYFVLLVGLIFVVVEIMMIFFPAEWGRLMTTSSTTDNSRWYLWETALKDWMKAPFFGNGLGYAYKAHGMASHNTYLQVLSETGLVGAVLFGSFLLSMLKKAYRTDKALFCALVGMMVQIVFLDALSNRCLWVLLCWIAMLPDKRGRTNEEVYP